MSNIYFAPMEGITKYIFRNAYEHYYGGITKYFAPFISPADNCDMNPKEQRDVLPENNKVGYLVPQILANKSVHFNACALRLKEMGYKEINLNLGCPSGTVTAKKKGSGFLAYSETLDAFLSDIYEFAYKNDLEISIKTRVGYNDTEDWERLVEIYNTYPIKELIIHPRIKTDMYKGSPRMECFDYAFMHSKNKLIYNGDIFTPSKLKTIDNKYNCEAIMLGRGLLNDPELILKINNPNKDFEKDKFLAFHDELFNEYNKIMSPEKNVLFHMKALWVHWVNAFPDKPKECKAILKSNDFSEYRIAIKKLLK